MDHPPTNGAPDSERPEDDRTERDLDAVDPVPPAHPVWPGVPSEGEMPRFEPPATGPTWSAAGTNERPATESAPPTPPFGGATPPSSPWSRPAAPPFEDGARTEPTAAFPSAAWAPAPGAAHPGATKPARERTGLRAAAIGAVVGALVGALAAGGIVAAVDDDGGTRTIVGASNDAPARPASVIQSPGDIQSILDRVKPAVVRINVSVNSSFGRAGEGVGTGFIISDDGYIVTNAHVVDDAGDVQVQLDDGQTVEGDVIGASEAHDLAVVKIDGENLPTVELGDSDELQVGDQVVAIGNALGLEGEPTVTSGIVSGLDRVLQEPNNVSIANTIQTDAAINPGNSGGPLVDAQGRVIGINTAIANPSESNNIGFAIAITPAKDVIDSLRAGDQPEVAFLGVGTQAVNAALRDEADLAVDQGAFVSSVESGSAADAAGIRRGDVIVDVDGTAITSSEDVINAVRRHSPGDTISITIDRDGDQQTFEVTLRARPA
jgi:S1-C subfamily serine protease